MRRSGCWDHDAGYPESAQGESLNIAYACHMHDLSVPGGSVAALPLGLCLAHAFFSQAGSIGMLVVACCGWAYAQHMCSFLV